MRQASLFCNSALLLYGDHANKSSFLDIGFTILNSFAILTSATSRTYSYAKFAEVETLFLHAY